MLSELLHILLRVLWLQPESVLQHPALVSADSCTLECYARGTASLRQQLLRVRFTHQMHAKMLHMHAAHSWQLQPHWQGRG